MHGESQFVTCPQIAFPPPFLHTLPCHFMPTRAPCHRTHLGQQLAGGGQVAVHSRIMQLETVKQIFSNQIVRNFPHLMGWGRKQCLAGLNVAPLPPQ